MVELIPGLPDNVLGFKAVGKIIGEDYERVVIPEIESRLENDDKLRAVYECGPEMTGFELKALWDDAKVGLKHMKAWEKIAVVSDDRLIAQGVKMFSFMIPCEVKVFEASGIEEAKAWASS